MASLDINGFAKSFGENKNDFSDNVLNEIKKYNFDYSNIEFKNYIELIMQILQKIDADKQIIGAQERKKVWFDGWEENLIDFKKYWT